MSYGRMKEEEGRLRAEIGDLLRKVESTDRAEDAEHGADRSGTELPDELKRHVERLQMIQAAKARLEARQRQADEAAGRSKDDDGNTRGPSGRRCERGLGIPIPDDQAQENFTDPQSRIMKTTEGFQQCYNGQAAVDEDSLLIVVVDLSNQAPDNGQLLPMLEQATANAGQAPEGVLADAGYPSEDTLRTLNAQGQPACVALGREDKKHRVIDPLCYPATAQMAQRLRSPEGRNHCRRRKMIPEPVFGWIKQALGFRRFSLRGLQAAKAEWHLVCMAVNLKRMHTLGWRAA